jgi:hypothetical protein
MVDPVKVVSEAEASANAAAQSEAPQVVAWFAHPVPVWALLPAFLVGALLSRLA